MSQIAYVMSCEILCGEGSDGDLEGIERAYLLVGVHAANEDEAMAKIEESFEEEGYALVEADWISPAAEVEWTDAEGEAEGKDLIARMAMIPDEVVYGPLYDADDVEEIDEAA
ncbi:hypothetical protein [Hyphomonas sp.]|uniref:hypothetical protein n=1 Tax=Hyphomonas sp. TaxID=87 RepID=UPI00391AF016